MSQQIKVEVCTCGHEKDTHTFFKSDTGIDLCACLGDQIFCKCTKYQIKDYYDDMIQNIDRYIIPMKKMVDKMQWVLLNLKFFRNYSDKYLPYAWKYYINHWDMWHEPLTPSIYQKLDDDQDICRARRVWREYDRKHLTNLYLPFEPTIEEEHQYRQYQMHEFFISQKNDWR